MSDYNLNSFCSDHENEQQEENIKDYLNDPKNPPDHRLRISIDIRSLKDQDFRGNIYVKYSSKNQLNIKQFKSTPVIQVTKPKVEETFENAFRSYIFDSNQKDLKNRMSEILEFEIWHQDRLKKDILIGIAFLKLENLLQAQVKKTSQSYARVYDVYLPVDELDEERNPIKKIAELRVILYLEDLGPKDQLNQKEKELGLDENEEYNNLEQQQQPLVLNDKNSDFVGDLEYKIIWELENWKKAEEQKFKIYLKQKEVDFLQKLNEEYKRKEIEKDKVFKKTECSINLLHKKIKEKANDLQKREQKIVLLEEELKTKIQDVSRQVSIKEDLIVDLKKKLKDEKGNSEKEKTVLKAQNEELKQEYNQLRKEYELFKKEQENSPISLVKNELKDKLLEIKELKKDIVKANEIKEQYKNYYEKLRNELIKCKKQLEMIKEENNFKNNSEIQNLKNEINQLKQQKENIFIGNLSKNNNNSQNLDKNNTIKQNLPFINNNESNAFSHFPDYNWDNQNIGELERLVQERDYLLVSGDYIDSDPLIVELNNQIKALAY